MRSLPGSAYYTRTEKLVTCKRCGQTGLVWTQNKSGKWYLAHTIRSQDDMKDHAGVVVAAPWIRHDCNETRQEHELALNSHLEELRQLELANASLLEAIGKIKQAEVRDEQDVRSIETMERIRAIIADRIKTEAAWIEFFDREVKQ